MSDRLKLALLGCGDVAQRDYLPEMYRLADRVEIVAVCGQGESRARAVAAQYGIPAWYTDYARMLQDSGADAVANLTPIQLHTEATLAALRAGKHVYSEKPLASTVRDAEVLRDEARRRGLVLVCAPCVMLFPQVRFAQELLRDGAIGPVYSARGQGHGGVPPWSGFPSDPSPFFALGGGPAVDMGVYPLHALTGLLGPARRVTALSACAQDGFTVEDGPYQGRHVPIAVDDNWHLVLDFGEARLASVEASNCVQATRAPQLELMGLEGTIALDLLDVAAPVGLWRRGRGWDERRVPHARQGGPDHVLGIEHLADCVQSGQEPLLSVERAIHVVAIIEAAAQSAREGRTINLTHTRW